jgi:hypothetical protein
MQNLTSYPCPDNIGLAQEFSFKEPTYVWKQQSKITESTDRFLPMQNRGQQWLADGERNLEWVVQGKGKEYKCVLQTTCSGGVGGVLIPID